MAGLVSGGQDEQSRVVLPPETGEQPSLSSGLSDAPWLNRSRPGSLYRIISALLYIDSRAVETYAVAKDKGRRRPRWPFCSNPAESGKLPPTLVSQAWAPYPPDNPTGITVFGGARLAEGFTGGDDLTTPCNALFHLELAATGERGSPIWSKLHSGGSGLRQPASRQGAGLVGLEGGLWLWGGRCANLANDPRVWWFDGTTWSVLFQEEGQGSKSKVQGAQRCRECFVSANIGDEVLVLVGVQGRNTMVEDAAQWPLNVCKRK